jgi:putative endonuclease
MYIGQVADMNMGSYLYILRSKTNARFYIGSTTDLNRRLEEHNLGKTKYTKATGPYELVFKQEYPFLIQARKAEMWLKSMKSRTLLEKIVSFGVMKKKF